jgi:hypothetical protein
MRLALGGSGGAGAVVAEPVTVVVTLAPSAVSSFVDSATVGVCLGGRGWALMAAGLPPRVDGVLGSRQLER